MSLFMGMSYGSAQPCLEMNAGSKTIERANEIQKSVRRGSWVLLRLPYGGDVPLPGRHPLGASVLRAGIDGQANLVEGSCRQLG